MGAMGHPGGGKNNIPNRLKRNFFMFNLVLPSITSINDIYGQMLRGRFSSGEFDADVMEVGRTVGGGEGRVGTPPRGQAWGCATPGASDPNDEIPSS